MGIAGVSSHRYQLFISTAMTDNLYRFRASKSQANLRLVNLPKHQLQAFKITINNKPTDLHLDRVTFKANDIIEIRRVDNVRDYPILNFRLDFVKELLAPLPSLGHVRSLDGLFEGCKNLRSVPRNIFVNNPHVTDFRDIFKDCSALALDVDLNSNGSIKLDGFASGCLRQATLRTRSPSRVQGYVNRAKDANAAIR